MKTSAGILPFRRTDGAVEVLLLHPAGPFWAHKNKWHFAQGETDEGEDELAAARREFLEEVGVPAPGGVLINLEQSKTPRKLFIIWAVESDVDLSHFPDTLQTNTFKMEWPPRSGQQQSFPENDRAEWFPLAQAHGLVFGYLRVFIERLAEYLGAPLEIDDSQPQQSLL